MTNPENLVDKILQYADEILRLLEGLEKFLVRIFVIVLTIAGLFVLVVQMLIKKFGG